MGSYEASGSLDHRVGADYFLLCLATVVSTWKLRLMGEPRKAMCALRLSILCAVPIVVMLRGGQRGNITGRIEFHCSLSFCFWCIEDSALLLFVPFGA